MKGGGYGMVADIILGLLGGVLGGWIFERLRVSTGGGMVGSIIVAFIGAVTGRSLLGNWNVFVKSGVPV